jgi:hypothetical protein
MTFLNPLLLLGLAAAAIPLIIHLFNFRRPKRVNFSSLAFLHELRKSTMQRVRVKQWLLLALRTLAIACLVLAFARPTMTGPLAARLGGSGRTTSAIVLDRSASMTLRDGGGAYLDQARALVGGLTENMESGDEVLFAAVPAADERAVFHQHASAVTAAVEDLMPGVGNATLTAAIRAAGARLQERPAVSHDVLVVSDLQRSTFSDSLDLDLPPGTRLLLLPVGTDGQGNLAVSDVRVLSQIVSEGQPVRFEATFTNHGDDAVRGLVASLILDGQRIGQATVDIEARSQATARFVAAPRSRGWLTGSVRIDDNRFLFDNERTFALHVPEERRILIVRGEGADARYVRLALSGSLSEAGSRFATQEIAETALASANLGQWDSVVLVGVASLSSGERAALSQYVRGGGGVLVFAGNAGSLDDFNAWFADLGAGSYRGIREVDGAGTAVGVFDRVDVEHPLFEGMFAPTPGGAPPTLEQPVLFRSLDYAPGGGNEQSVIGLSGGQPFLQEVRVDQGSLLLFSVEAGASWSDFPVRGLFLPMMHRALVYLSAGASVTGETMEAASSLQVLLQGVASGVQVTVQDSTGTTFLPEQRDVFGGKVLTVSGSFFQPGVYDVLEGTTIRRRVVVHAPASESDLTLLDPEEAAAHLSTLTDADVAVLQVSMAAAAPLEEQLREARTGVELWNVFLALALAFLVAEMVVSRQFRPEAAS